MTQATQSESFRSAAETEGGMPVSAGARVAHVARAVDAGRAFYVDLSKVPQEMRPSIVADIQDLVKRASAANLSPNERIRAVD